MVFQYFADLFLRVYVFAFNILIQAGTRYLSDLALFYQVFEILNNADITYKMGLPALGSFLADILNKDVSTQSAEGICFYNLIGPPPYLDNLVDS